MQTREQASLYHGNHVVQLHDQQHIPVPEKHHKFLKVEAPHIRKIENE
jgi:hypothetical protein